MEPPRPTICQLLRQQTAEAHCRLERRIENGGFFTARDGYALLLRRLYGFYMPVETVLSDRPEWQDLGFDYSRRRRVHLIVADLVALGWPEPAVRQIPTCSDLPPLNDFAHGLGVMYVLEGSTLGGALISRRLRATLGVHDGDSGGGRFFAGYGPRIGRMWREFTAFLEGYSQSRGRADDHHVAAGARETFLALERWLLDQPPSLYAGSSAVAATPARPLAAATYSSL